MPKVPIDYTSIFIGQLDRSTTEHDVRERFAKYGTVVGVQVLAKAAIVGRRPSESGVTGFAFVKFESREAATKAVKAEVQTILLCFLSYCLSYPSDVHYPSYWVAIVVSTLGYLFGGCLL